VVNLPGESISFSKGSLQRLVQKIEPRKRLVRQKKGKTIEGNSLNGLNNFIAFQLRQQELRFLPEAASSSLFYNLFKTETTNTLFP